MFPDGAEAAVHVQEAIEKQRAMHLIDAEPPQLIAEFQDIMQHFAFHFPGEDLSPDEARALSQLMSPLRRKT